MRRGVWCGSVSIIDEFRAEHVSIEAGLVTAERLVNEPPQLLAQLKTMRATVVQHFNRKDAFYPALASQCAAVNDAAGAQLTRIFESNMKVQSAAVVRFFEGFGALPAESLGASFKTVATVIRQRFSTEEKALFPLFLRSLKPKDVA